MLVRSGRVFVALPNIVWFRDLYHAQVLPTNFLGIEARNPFSNLSSEGDHLETVQSVSGALWSRRSEVKAASITLVTDPARYGVAKSQEQRTARARLWPQIWLALYTMERTEGGWPEQSRHFGRIKNSVLYTRDVITLRNFGWDDSILAVLRFTGYVCQRLIEFWSLICGHYTQADSPHHGKINMNLSFLQY